jgi:predicted glycoside hydrolase/deacetylase ChbG (UPF0249 family)
MSRRTVIVNADDLGYSEGVNLGIIRGHVHGIVTSASLMVLRPGAAHAARLVRVHDELAVGLHFDLGEWRFDDGVWARVNGPEVLNLESVGAEARRQLAIFRNLIGRLPTHIDSHQHIHRQEPARSALVELALELGIPLRHFSAEIRYCGDFYGQTDEGAPLPQQITVSSLTRILRALPPGVTELGCHPGDAVDFDSTYRDERLQEVDVLCSPEIRRTLQSEEIDLRSFTDPQ